MSDPLAHAERSATGRYVLYAVPSGARYERGEEQAREMLASGRFSLVRGEHTADTQPEASAPAVVVALPGHEELKLDAPRRKRGSK